MRRSVEEAVAFLLIWLLVPTLHAQQPPLQPDVTQPSEAVSRLRAVATGRLSLPVSELVETISAGLQDAETQESALLAVAGRGALPRFRPGQVNVNTWRLERGGLQTLRPAVERLLQGNSERTRAYAVLALGTLGLDPDRLPEVVVGESVLSTLNKAYANESSVLVRTEIVKTAALCADNARSRRDLLAAALLDPSPDVLALAAKGLGTTQAPEALPQLVQLLLNPNANVRLAAAQALAKYDGAAVPYLGALEAALNAEKDELVSKTLKGTISVLSKLR